MAQAGGGEDRRARLVACIDHLGHVLPGQAAIQDFVHHNTLHGFQHLPFPEALAAAGRRLGTRPWQAEEDSRACYRAGRIGDSDLDAAIGQVASAAGIDPEATLARWGDRVVTRREVIRASLLHPLSPLPLALLNWQIEEKQAVLRCQAELPAVRRSELLAGGSESQAVSTLWAACMEVLDIDPAQVRPEQLQRAARRELPPQTSDDDDQAGCAARALALWEALADGVGAGDTVRGLLCKLSGEDALENVRSLLIRQLAAHLDQGLAAWSGPQRGAGFFAAWKEAASRDPGWVLDQAGKAGDEIAQVPADPLDAIIALLQWLDLPEQRWPGYLESLALELPGWSGMVFWRQQHPGHAGTAGVPVQMTDYLAVRLMLERLACGAIARRYWNIEATLPALGEYFQRHPAELLVRHAYYDAQLAEPLIESIEPWLADAAEASMPRAEAPWAALARQIDAWQHTATAAQSAAHGLAHAAWPLFLLAQHLGMGAAALRGIGRPGADAMLACLRQLDADQRGYLWLLAYERHYREQILGGLAANHGRWRGHARVPRAQLVFCMDDREEGMRRHLEEIAPELETLGGAAHFAVFQNYYGLDDSRPAALCPVIPEVIVPAHEVREVARKVGAGDTAPLLEKHRRRLARRLYWRELLNQATRRSLLLGPLLVFLAAPFALVALLWRSLAPAACGGFFARLRQRFDLPVPTRLDHTAAADAGPATPQAPRQGFTEAEQAERVAGFLTALGLTRDFAPLLVIMGHGANSANNPHLAAYDCGACSGRHSGPNARLFAAMANRPGVRRLLAARGIVLPATSWFIGAEHNTTDDRISWYDLEDLPGELGESFAELDRALAAAGREHARERCRRLYSAPLDIAPEAAFRHVSGRRHDWSQARPELGHATNACAFIGRRAMSRGAFFDRRAFLISYDPTRDADGRVLERHLLANGAVGAGISLEYFFSTVNNEHFGCGSKVTHNITGYFGVMHGAASDLATGLPRQMIEVHEAMRLLVVVEQTTELVTAIYQRQPAVQELVGKGWVVVAAKHPDSGEIHLFDPVAGWLPWQGRTPPATLRQSLDWFAGKREPLAPVLLERPLVAGVPA